MEQLHGRVVHIAQGRHDVRKAELLGKFRRRARRKFIIDGFAVFVRRNRHLVVVPCVTALFGGGECPIHQLFPERLVDVNEAQLPERRQDQIFFDLFHFAECDRIPAHIVKAHDGNAVVGAACAVVKIPLAAEVGAPLGRKLCVF